VADEPIPLVDAVPRRGGERNGFLEASLGFSPPNQRGAKPAPAHSWEQCLSSFAEPGHFLGPSHRPAQDSLGAMWAVGVPV